MGQPLPQCWSTNSVPRAFFPRVAIGCRVSLKIDRNLSPSWAGGGLNRGYMIWYGVNRRYGIWRIFIQISDDDCTRTNLLTYLLTYLSTSGRTLPEMEISRRSAAAVPVYLHTYIPAVTWARRKKMFAPMSWTVTISYLRKFFHGISNRYDQIHLHFSFHT